jgi:hypothetical protein
MRAQLIHDKLTGIVSNELGTMFYLISKNLTNHRHFIRYDHDIKEDMIMDGVTNCIRYYKTFDETRGTSILAYFTQTCYNSFRAYLKKEYSFTNFKDLYLDQCVMELEEELAEC